MYNGETCVKDVQHAQKNRKLTRSREKNTTMQRAKGPHLSQGQCTQGFKTITKGQYHVQNVDNVHSVSTA